MMRCAALLLLLTGCGLRAGFVRDATTSTRFDVQVQADSIQFMRLAHGSASTGYVLCSYPLGEPIYATASARMYEMAKLGPGEMLANMREDHEALAILFFWCEHRLTLSADVVRTTAKAVR